MSEESASPRLDTLVVSLWSGHFYRPTGRWIDELQRYISGINDPLEMQQPRLTPIWRILVIDDGSTDDTAEIENISRPADPLRRPREEHGIQRRMQYRFSRGKRSPSLIRTTSGQQTSWRQTWIF